MTDDIARLIGAVTREVRTETYEGKDAKVVVASRVYDTSVKDLWDAITNAERLPRWFAPVTGELMLGGKYQVQGNASGTITRCEPPRELAMRVRAPICSCATSPIRKSIGTNTAPAPLAWAGSWA